MKNHPKNSLDYGTVLRCREKFVCIRTCVVQRLQKNLMLQKPDRHHNKILHHIVLQPYNLLY